MQFTFLDMAGQTLFIRDDAERAVWTQEEMTLDLEFPYIDSKVVSIGQRVFFKDPSTGEHQIYEVRQAQTNEPDHYQIITAEHICIAELSDEFIDSSEVTDKTAQNALQTVLNNTLWSVGNVATNPTSSANLSRGSVWQCVLEIGDNWNVYIEPRVTFSSNGTITRKLDIVSTSGVWNGVRLSVDKNMLDPAVIYDDSETITALYGFGGTDPNDTSEEPQETTFKDVVWSKTNSHPAKPKGQTYLEDPTATALYGRNGRAKFGYYQNNDITDPNILLQKTWETLKTQNKPAISIEGTVADLYRLGYADQPIKLHDIAQVEVIPVGYKDRIQIIRMTSDLLDPTATTLTIGAYIPNIIYIERRTNQDATGSRGGGGGGNKNKETNTWREFRTTIDAYQDGTGIKFKAVQNDIEHQEQEIAIQEGHIEVLYNKITLEVTDRREADNELSSKITVTAREIRSEVKSTKDNLQSQITQNANQIELKVSKGAIASTINQTAQSVRIQASKINLDGYVTAKELSATNADIANLKSGSSAFTLLKAGSVQTGTLRVSNTLAIWKEKFLGDDYGWIHYLGY